MQSDALLHCPTEIQIRLQLLGFSILEKKDAGYGIDLIYKS